MQRSMWQMLQHLYSSGVDLAFQCKDSYHVSHYSSMCACVCVTAKGGKVAPNVKMIIMTVDNCFWAVALSDFFLHPNILNKIRNTAEKRR